MFIHATGVSLLLFASKQDHIARFTMALDPCCNRTGEIWHLI
jgi:hypothetical protein